MRSITTRSVETALLAVVAVVALVSCSGDDTAGSTSSEVDTAGSTSTESPSDDVTKSPPTEDQPTAEATTEAETDAACQWIDDSDVVIRLDLPEEYAHFNDATIFPSYATGFLFKSSHGDVAISARLAQKGCDYRVGFTREDFAGLDVNPNYPLVVVAENGSSTHLTYAGEPRTISIGADGLPEQGTEFVLEVTGETQAFGHYDSLFE